MLDWARIRIRVRTGLSLGTTHATLFRGFDLLGCLDSLCFGFLSGFGILILLIGLLFRLLTNRLSYRLSNRLLVYLFIFEALAEFPIHSVLEGQHLPIPHHQHSILEGFLDIFHLRSIPTPSTSRLSEQFGWSDIMHTILPLQIQCTQEWLQCCFRVDSQFIEIHINNCACW